MRKFTAREYNIKYHSMLSLRLGGCDYAEGGNTIEDSIYASKVLADSGVDMLNITGGMCRYTRQGHDEPGYFQDMLSAIKKAVAIPVMLTSGVKTLEDADALLKNNAADLIPKIPVIFYPTPRTQ